MVRQRTNLNREWRFVRADVTGAHQADFDDSAWQAIGLPHSFDLPYFRTPEFYVGYGWYRRRVDLPALGARRVFLEFDGVFQAAKVFVNGICVGEHRGGYTGFCLDVTDAARAGANLIAVRVNNLWNAQLAPRAGEHIFSGGIYRDVHLFITAPVHVTWNGTFITTPRITRNEATVNARIEVHNHDRAEKTVAVTTRILQHGARAFAETTTTQLLPRESISTIDHQLDRLRDFKLWSPDHPHLYTVHTQVRDEQDRLLDAVESPLGFRWFEWTADRGFFLNGKHLYLRGANVHQDHAGWGIGITQAAIERDVKLIKEAGFNFIRGAHYPHHPAFAAACDRLGVLFWSENCFWGKGGFGPEGYWNASAYPVNKEDFEPFEQSSKDALREMIRINRNHPSIIAWSMTNEAFFTYNLDRAKNLISDLVTLSHELDPTRPAAIGGAQRGGVDRLGDIAGYNGDGARLFIDPGMPNMVSEYGAISKPHASFEPFFGEMQNEQFTWRSGQAIWAGFDYGSIAGRQGLKGILDHSRLPKQSWHWYRQAYCNIAPPPRPEPGTAAMLLLSADRTTILGTDAIEDAQVIVTVCNAAGQRISNSPPVTLTIESGPGEFPTGASITFDAETDIKINEGQAAIAFRSYHAGVTVIRATSPGLQDATITLTITGEPAYVPDLKPSAHARPYTPPPVSAAAQAAMKNTINVARDRPSRASSEAEGHTARLGNDSSPQHWMAADANVGAWWQVDLEGFYQLSSSKITFAAAGNYRFIVDISQNGVEWERAIDRSGTENAAPVRNDIYPPGAVARYVRLIFTALPPGSRAGLVDFEIHGILSVR